MSGFLESIPSHFLILASIGIPLAWTGYSFYRRWTDLRGSLHSMVRSMERIDSDISNLPWIEGLITTSRVRSFQTRAEQSDPETTMYRPELAYAYSIDGKSYSGVGDTFHITFSEPEPAAEIAGKYPPGTRVRVYFRREDPQISYLDMEEIHSNLGAFRDSLKGVLE